MPSLYTICTYILPSLLLSISLSIFLCSYHSICFSIYLFLYSEQKKLEAKELKREAQGKKAEFDLQAKKAAEVALLKTLASKPGMFNLFFILECRVAE